MIHAYAGPSRPSKKLPVMWHPPVRFGDLSSSNFSCGDIVVIVDATLWHHPGPTHQEILKILSDGVPVYGCSSTGALRAAELYNQGMIGAGATYWAFRHQLLEDDGELCVAMHPTSFRAMSVPLVRVRAALKLLENEKRFCDFFFEALRIARNIHFTERFSGVLREALCTVDVQFANVVHNLVCSDITDIKGRDAEELLSALCSNDTDGLGRLSFQNILDRLYFDTEHLQQVERRRLLAHG